MESASITQPIAGGGSKPFDKGLKTGAIGYMSNLVISIASTAPAYSMAATLGFIVAVAGVGLQAPAIMLVSFIPMLFIASAYKYMNKADPDCGTTFTWATRALGPATGWLGGWAIIMSDVICMATLAQIAAVYTFSLFGINVSQNGIWVILAGVVWIAVMTWICYVGIELSARIQQALLSLEVVTLAAFAVVAIVKVYANHPAGSIEPSFSWFNPFAISSTKAMLDGVLLGLFIYWGWDSGVAVNEESENASEGPGKAAVVSTLLLLVIYLVVSAAAQAYAGPHALSDPANQNDVLAFLGSKVFPHPLNKLLTITVLTSASASTQTTILPTARTSLSMARWGAIPKAFGRIHPRYKTPTVSTLVMGAVSIIWFIIIVPVSLNVLGDSITAIGFQIAFYYGLTGVVCAVYYRRELFKSARNFWFVGVAPLVGGLMMLVVFVEAAIFYGHAANNYSPDALGIGLPDVMGIGVLLLGVVLWVVLRFALPGFYQGRKLEVADPAVLESTAS